VKLLALAAQLGVLVWSNDRDLENAGAAWYATAALLAALE
jgi:hypothetical protein